jgi:hypothetical protein
MTKMKTKVIIPARQAISRALPHNKTTCCVAGLGAGQEIIILSGEPTCQPMILTK